jgi:hypothetical protein
MLRCLYFIALFGLSSCCVLAQSALPAATTWQVNLTCTPPVSSPDPVAGYLFLRAPSGSTSYAQLNAKATTGCGYTDTGATPGATWNYIAESVDAQGVASAPSNMAVATIPAVLTAGTLAGKTT